MQHTRWKTDWPAWDYVEAYEFAPPFAQDRKMVVATGRAVPDQIMRFEMEATHDGRVDVDSVYGYLN